MAAKRLTPAEREKRDRLILDLFVSGYKKQDIAVHPQVQLTWQRVNEIINNELKQVRKDQVVLNEHAMEIHLARMEILIQQAMEHVQGGELKAIEPARRLLAEQAKLFGLADDSRGGGTPPISDNEMADMDDDDQMDELARWRSRGGQPPPPKAAGDS